MKTAKLGKRIALEIQAQRAYLVIWAPVCFAAGVLLYFLPGQEPALWQAAVLFILGTLIVAVSLLQRFESARPVFFAMALCAAGYAAIGFQVHHLSTPLLLERLGPVMVEGQVERISPGKKGSLRVMIRDVTLDMVPSRGAAPVRVRLTSRHADSLAVGSRISIRAMLMPPSGPVLPGGFDFQKMAFFQGFGAVGYTIGQPQVLEESGRGFISSIRHVINNRIAGTLDGDRAALAQALLTGERRGISEGNLSAIRDAGLAHLLAISGLHIGMVAGLIFVSVRFLLACFPAIALYYPIKKWAAIAALLVAFVYMLLAGATIPTIRAFLMTGLVLVAVMLDRTALTLRLVCIAALIILMINPYAITSVSFQLSFAAVTALIAFHDGFGRRWMARSFRHEWWARVLFYVGGIILTSLIATLATAPLTLYTFNRVPVYGILSNIMAIPLMGLWVMPSGLLALLAMPLGLESLPLQVMGKGVEWLAQIARLIAEQPFSILHYPSIPDMWMVAVMAGFIWLCLWQGWLRLMGGVVMVVAFFAAPKLTDWPILISQDAAHVAVYDGGQLFLSGPGPDDYMFSQWLEDWGLPETVPIQEFTACDMAGCGMVVQGKRLIHATDGLSTEENCRKADILISCCPVADNTPCDALLIDRFDVWADGAMAARIITNGDVESISVEGQRGARLWTTGGQINRYGTIRSKHPE